MPRRGGAQFADSPKGALLNYLQKNNFGDGSGGAKLQIETVAAEEGRDAAKCGYRSTVRVPTPSGDTVTQTATHMNKKAAEATAVEMVLKVLRSSGLMHNVKDVMSAPASVGAPAAGGGEPDAKRMKFLSFDFDDGASAAPPPQEIPPWALEMSQQKLEAEGGPRQNDGFGGGKGKVMFGYTIESAKGCLLQYLRKKGLSDKIPSVPLQQAGPFCSWLEIPLQNGQVIRQSCEATKLKEAATYLALDVVADLVQHGELAPFQGKTDATREGLQPMDAGGAQFADSPKGALINYLQKNNFGDGSGGAKLQIETVAAEEGRDAAKCGYRSTVRVPTPSGDTVTQTATHMNKKAAEATAVEMVLTSLRISGLMHNVKDVASASVSGGAPAAGGGEPSAKRMKFSFEDGAGAAPPPQEIPPWALEMSQQKAGAEGGPRQYDGKGGGKRKVMFGYTFETAKACLLQYLRKRGLSDKIPSVPLQQAGPFCSWLEIPLPNGQVIRQSCEATKLKEAATYLALDAVADLVQHGELAPFQSKTDVMREGLQPMDAGLAPEAEARLTAALDHLGVPVGGSGQSVQPWVDASAWATTPTAREITWAPPVWGENPWERNAREFTEEREALARLCDEQDRRRSNPVHEGMRARRRELPISHMTGAILNAIEDCSVVMVSGSTGCGKTTQLPQLLLERAVESGTATRMNILCTQPRRIAAITVAERVAEERGEALGNSVGYVVRFNKQPPRGYASVCFMTTGMLLRRMASQGLRGVSHLIIDEVHERDLDTDFLLTIVRKLAHKSPDLKIILMSATILLDKWSEYFGQGFGAQVEIPGRLFPVRQYFLEDAERLVGQSAGKTSGRPGEDDEVDHDFVESLLRKLVDKSLAEDRGAILVFLPGWEAISEIQKKVQRGPLRTKCSLHALHSKVPKDEQQAAFQAARPPLVKIVLSTNIAESSVTISDVVYVVDSCRVKQLMPIQSPGGRTAYRLASSWAAKQNLQQRSGRAGRVREGECYRLVTKAMFERMPFSNPPEMHRLPLHQVTLTVKALNLGSAVAFLNSAPDPPPPGSVQQAILALQDLKALDHDERITSLGLEMHQLPFDPRTAFSLLAARMMGLEQPIAILAAFGSCQTPYSNEHKRQKQAVFGQEQSHKMLSDHHNMLLLYYQMQSLPQHMAVQFCMREKINYKVMQQVFEITGQTITKLSQTLGGGVILPADQVVAELGTPLETPQHKHLWDAIVFLLGLSMEHISVRKGLSRKVWLSAGKESTVSVSPGIPEVPHEDQARPFYVFKNLQENEWRSNCREVSAASAVSTVLGAARDLRWDPQRCCLLVDGWAPLRMQYRSAQLLGAARQGLRVCLLNACRDCAAGGTPDQATADFAQVLKELCNPQAHVLHHPGGVQQQFALQGGQGWGGGGCGGCGAWQQHAFACDPAGLGGQAGVTAALNELMFALGATHRTEEYS